MPRPVALLDVDHTLLFGNRLNQKLVDSLKNKGIKDLYLFTDMTFKNTSIIDRTNLIQQLEDNGFIVHGVITPNDLTWDSIPAEEAQKLHTWCFDGTYRGKLVGEEFELFIQSKQEELPKLSQAIANYSPDNKIIGKGFADAANELKENAILSTAIIARSYFAKSFADHLGEKYGYAHNKGLLLDLFLRHRPKWVSSIVVADDNDQVIQSITDFKPVDKLMPLPPITLIAVSGENTETAVYEAQLTTHLEMDPFTIINEKVDIINRKIDLHIQQMISGWNPFLSSSQAKIDALELLKEHLLTADLRGRTISDVIEEWQDSIRFRKTNTEIRVPISEVIAQHRNIFRATSRPDVETNTQIFLKNLKLEHRDILSEPAERPSSFTNS